MRILNGSGKNEDCDITLACASVISIIQREFYFIFSNFEHVIQKHVLNMNKYEKLRLQEK